MARLAETYNFQLRTAGPYDKATGNENGVLD